jgi:hypothetical protein
MENVIMLSVGMLNVILLSVVVLIDIMLSVNMLYVIMLSVVAPCINQILLKEGKLGRVFQL